jgi:hypothetical protein
MSKIVGMGPLHKHRHEFPSAGGLYAVRGVYRVPWHLCLDVDVKPVVQGLHYYDALSRRQLERRCTCLADKICYAISFQLNP